jgi:hypothetical protein
MTEKWKLAAVENIPKPFKVGERRAAGTFDTVKSELFQHKTSCFIPFASNEHEILLDDFGF